MRLSENKNIITVFYFEVIAGSRSCFMATKQSHSCLKNSKIASSAEYQNASSQ
jgi:hypothetical protein